MITSMNIYIFTLIPLLTCASKECQKLNTASYILA